MKFFQAVPMTQFKQQVQNMGVVRLWEESIEHWYSTLFKELDCINPRWFKGEFTCNKSSKLWAVIRFSSEGFDNIRHIPSAPKGVFLEI